MDPPLKQRILFLVSCALIALCYSKSPLLAQSGIPDVTADEVNKVARQLWCPLCGGRLRLDSCELKACAQMKDVIALQLAEGEEPAAIRDYFLEQYGPQVLGVPPRQGFNWLAWLLPVAAVMGGGLFLWLRLRRMTAVLRPAAVSLQDTGPDEQERRLDEELARYD